MQTLHDKYPVCKVNTELDIIDARVFFAVLLLSTLKSVAVTRLIQEVGGKKKICLFKLFHLGKTSVLFASPCTTAVAK